MIKIVAKAKVKPENKAKFIELAKPLVAASQAEEGNVSYNLHESLEDPNVMAFIEVWKDQAAIDFHNATAHFTTICPQFADLFDGPMEVAHFVEVV
ncbi:MAG: putative quinol monooxygenase [Intestinibacillus sp.]